MQITDAAKEFIKKVLKENNAEGIRVTFAGMSCCSPKMGLSLDEPDINDVVRVINGIKVAFENRIVPHAQNVTLDYQVTPSGSGLVMLGNSGCC